MDLVCAATLQHRNPEISEQHASQVVGLADSPLFIDGQFQAIQNTWQHAATSCKHCH